MRTETTTTPLSFVEPVTMSEVLGIASWDRPRTNEELQAFRSRREELLGSLDLDSLVA